MKKYSSKRAKKGKLAFRTPSSFVERLMWNKKNRKQRGNKRVK